GIGGHLSAQGRTAAPGEPGHLSGSCEERALQGNSGAVMAGPSDQDKLADDWGLDDLGTASEAPVEVDESEMNDDERAAAAAAEWAAMLEGGDGDGEGGADRVLNQDEIDSLLGFDSSAGSNLELTGVQALIN